MSFLRHYMTKRNRFNEYLIIRKEVHLRIFGKGKYHETIIDLEDFGKIQSYTWYAIYNPPTKSFYASGNILLNKKRKQKLLHRFIMDCPSHLQIDHMNHNTLDNRKSNMRIVTSQENHQNRKGANSDNKTSKFRGVCYKPKLRTWVGRVFYKGHCYWTGSFKSEEEAHKSVVFKRNKLYGVLK